VTRPGVYYNSISGGCPRGGNLVGTHCRLVDLGLPLNIPTKVGSQYLWIDLHPSWPGVYYRKIRGSCSAGDVPDQSNCKIRDLNGLTEYTKGPSSVYYTPKANVCSVGGRLVNGKCEVVRILPIDFGSIASIKSLSSNGWLDGRSRGILDSLWADPNRHPPSDHFLQWRISQIGTSGLYSIRSVSSSQWLDGRAVTESPVFVSDPARNPASDHFLQWRIHSYGAGIYALQSVSSNCWLDGRSIWQTQVPLITAAADPRTYASGHPFLLFEIKAL
jgi:hypothetical protein